MNARIARRFVAHRQVWGWIVVLPFLALALYEFCPEWLADAPAPFSVVMMLGGGLLTVFGMLRWMHDGGPLFLCLGVVLMAMAVPVVERLNEAQPSRQHHVPRDPDKQP